MIDKILNFFWVSWIDENFDEKTSLICYAKQPMIQTKIYNNNSFSKVFQEELFPYFFTNLVDVSMIFFPLANLFSLLALCIFFTKNNENLKPPLLFLNNPWAQMIRCSFKTKCLVKCIQSKVRFFWLEFK